MLTLLIFFACLYLFAGSWFLNWNLIAYKDVLQAQSPICPNSVNNSPGGRGALFDLNGD